MVPPSREIITRTEKQTCVICGYSRPEVPLEPKFHLDTSILCEHASKLSALEHGILPRRCGFHLFSSAGTHVSADVKNGFVSVAAFGALCIVLPQDLRIEGVSAKEVDTGQLQGPRPSRALVVLEHASLQAAEVD